jgi:ATP-dependent Clp protease protease subunit
MNNKGNEPTNRNLMLSEEVTQASVRPIIEKIGEINREDDKKERDKNLNYDRSKSPIILTVNTPGGSVSAGLALIDIMKTSKTPIHALGLGMVASMGVPIILSAHKAFSYENTMFMIHDVTYGAFGTFVQHERRMEAIDKFSRQKVFKIILDNTNIRSEDIQNANEEIKDWFFDADEAIKLGVVESKVTLTRLSVDDVKKGNFVVEQ